MGALLLPLFSIFMLLTTQSAGLPGVHDSLVALTTTVRELAELDAELANHAERILAPVNLALDMNYALGALQAQCPAAIASYTVPALQAQAEAVRVAQDLLLQEAALSAQLISSLKYARELNSPERGLPQGPCKLPDFLRCRVREILFIRHHDGAKPAGISAETNECKDVRWQYDDARVQVLR